MSVVKNRSTAKSNEFWDHVESVAKHVRSKKKSERTCAYCGEKSCGCRYRLGKMGGGCFEMQNVSRQSTVAEFREEFNRFTENMKQDASAVWMWSVTKLDDKKIDKSDQKRRAKKVTNRLLGRRDRFISEKKN